jgi:NAD(P)-dependent dehydrogenase (short-subunit alcohol dehydrogenase family)
LSGQTAIVTGAATGIGEAIAKRLAAAGATIAVLDLDLLGAELVAAALGDGSFAIEADVTQTPREPLSRMRSAAPAALIFLLTMPASQAAPLPFGNRLTKTGSGISR